MSLIALKLGVCRGNSGIKFNHLSSSTLFSNLTLTGCHFVHRELAYTPVKSHHRFSFGSMPFKKRIPLKEFKIK